MMRWGLIPHWAKDMKIGYKLLNARAETIIDKPVFRVAFKRRRCLLPATGFYEWKHDGKRKQPYFIKIKDAEPFAFAGIWERWTSPEEEVFESCSIITTESNKIISEIHNRMPVIVDPAKYDLWLNPDTKQEHLIPLLKSYPSKKMMTYPVSDIVNSPKNDTPQCIEQLKLF